MRRVVALALGLLVFLTTDGRAQNVPVVIPSLTNVATGVLNLHVGKGILAWAACANSNTGLAWLQVFDTTGTVTVGTTPPYASLPVVTNQGSNPGAAGATLMLRFNNGIKVAATTTINGGTALSTPLSCTIGFQ